jgi:glycosyltransferase involved in cell wall biosynthesis
VTERPPKLLFLVTEDWYFCSHRLPLAVAARANGFEVVVATRVNRDGARITAAGLRLIPLKWSRRGLNPFMELGFIWKLIQIYRREKPDVVHHVAIKPVLYGSLAAWFSSVPGIVNAFGGLGFIFSSQTRMARAMRPLTKAAFQLLLNVGHSLLIVQHSDDRQLLVDRGMIDGSRVRVIRGAGVDVSEFVSQPEPDGIPLVMLASRLLWDKGVGTFVDVARNLLQHGIKARFVIVGQGDPENPASIPDEQLMSWQESGFVEWWGRRSDMASVLSSAHMICLPTAYGEGVPKVLLEAAACGRPIIATDVPGCREIVRHGENGLLVPLRDVTALAEAIRYLVGAADIRRKMGLRGRAIAESEFSVERVIHETLCVYQELLATRKSWRDA